MPASTLSAHSTGSDLPDGGKAVTLYCHLDIVDRHPNSTALGCITGWIVAEKGYEITGLGLRLDEATVVRCNYPFHRSDVRGSIALAGSEALIGFNIVLPARLGFAPERLTFVARVAADDRAARPLAFTVDRRPGQTRELLLDAGSALPGNPDFVEPDPAETSAVLESRLFDHLASRRCLTLRLDLINKCNLRCVMCHYSNESFAKRPVRRIAPEQFSAFFDPIAPITREVVLSCGDEPLMSPHFAAIIRDLAARDPEVRISFCTNGMLLGDKNAAAIMAANTHLVMFSFDGVASETLHRIRVGSDYRRIIGNIVHLQRLRAESGRSTPHFVFNFVMLESNIHEAPLFAAVARRLGGDCIDFRHAVPFDFYDIEHERLEYNKPKYNHYRERILAAAAAAGIEVYLPPAFDAAARHDPAGDPAASLAEFHQTLRDLGEDPRADGGRIVTVANAAAPHESAHFFCDRPFSEVMIYDQKDVYPCPWHREKMGTLEAGATLGEIFFGENFRRVRLAMLNPHGAPGCSHCPIKANYLPTRLP